MAVLSLAVRDFRNIESAELAFGPGLNLITGDNGAGKTSLLEALYVLGRARSFRTAQVSHLIRNGAEHFLVTGRVCDPGGREIQVGIQRSKSGGEVRLDGRSLRNLAELAHHFPFHLITPDSHKLLEAGPRSRRRFVDAGVFHVEPAFFSAWQRFSKALRQRNAALRAGAARPEIELWNREVVASAELLDQQRRSYLDKLTPILDRWTEALAGISGLAWSYRRGWSSDRRYEEVLAEGLDGDRRQGFTRAGPHRADFLPMLGRIPAQERISRGQQKLLVIAMAFAQASLFQQERERPSLFLVDDLASELDAAHRDRVLQNLSEMQAQIFLTALDRALINDISWSEPRRFHVEHGVTNEVVY